MNTIKCPQCNAIGVVTPDSELSKLIGKPYFNVDWTLNGKPHSRDTNVKQEDFEYGFGCGLD